MDFFSSILLGLVQGFTEFLPVSSSGHLVLAVRLLGVEFSQNAEMFFDCALHLGTLFAVVIYLRKDIWVLLKSPFGKRVGMLVVATVPACVLGLLFSDFVAGFFSFSCVIVGFYFSAFILLFASRFAKLNQKGEIDYKSATLMGFAQSLALLPGVSRSGSTLLSGLAVGKEKEEVAKFSFLMSIPIILGSFLLSLFKVASVGVDISLLCFSLVGCISAFVFGILGIRFFFYILKKAKLEYFSFYLFALASLLLFFAK